MSREEDEDLVRKAFGKPVPSDPKALRREVRRQKRLNAKAAKRLRAKQIADQRKAFGGSKRLDKEAKQVKGGCAVTALTVGGALASAIATWRGWA